MTLNTEHPLRWWLRCGAQLGVLACAFLAPVVLSAATGRRLIVREGKPLAVVVIADRSTAVADYAAQELVYHVRKATGATLPVVRESDAPAVPAGGVKVFLGPTRAAALAGIRGDRLEPETFVLRTASDSLFIVGKDAAGDPLDVNTYAGTLFGVYEWLERDLGVRWLWPGELGTYVPEAATVAVTDVDDTVAPAFFQRNVRGGLTFQGSQSGLGFTPEAATEYAKVQTIYLRRHRMGKSHRISYRHAFTDWWAKYGAEHPEWFQLVNGRRGPTRPGASYSMCVSNPELHRKIVELWKAARGTEAGPGPSYLNAVENGIMGLCECEQCRAWDAPQPEDFLTYYSPKSKMMGSRYVTDRYARFWLAVQREAAKTDPGVTIIVYNYFNYFYRPSPAIALNPNILVGSYPSAGWFPRSTEEQEWFKQQWTGWSETGARLFSRGNYCLDGYAMPLIFAQQFADEFKHQFEHGMVATDYDALTGQWSTQGTNIYLLMRLQLRPRAAAGKLLAEYYAAFGRAAPLVRAYFDYWEGYAMANRERINQAFIDLDASRWRSWGIAAHAAFPADSFAPAEALLDRAAAAVTGDVDGLARVNFLRTGLVHARLCARVASLLTVADPDSTPERGRQALQELIDFRRAHEREWIGNFNHSAWTEEASWRLSPPTESLTQAATNKL